MFIREREGEGGMDLDRDRDMKVLCHVCFELAGQLPVGYKEDDKVRRTIGG